MALIPKTITLDGYLKRCPYGKTKIEIMNIRQDMFEALYKSLDFFSAYYLNPGISQGNVLHTQYWNKMLKLFGAIEI